MKKIFTLSAAIIFSVNGFGQITFQKTYPGSGYTQGYAGYQTSDSGFIAAGITNDFGPTDANVYLMKTDASGNLVWSKIYGGTGSDVGFYLAQTSDNGYIITGATDGFGAGESDIYLLKTGENGNVLWAKTYGDTANEYAYCVQQTNDQGYIICGYTEGFGPGFSDIYIIKTDSLGNINWSKVFVAGSNNANNIKQTSDGGYIVVGGTPLTLIKLDANGDSLWTLAFNGMNLEWANGIEQTNDGGYIIAGYTNSFGSGGDAYIIKLDNGGALEWSKVIGETSYDGAYCIHQTTDNGYIVTGWGYPNGIGPGDASLIKLNSSGSVLWAKSYGGPSNNVGRMVRQTNDGGYIITGTYGGGNLYLIKTDSMGNSGCNEVNLTVTEFLHTNNISHPTFNILSVTTIVTTPITAIYNVGSTIDLCAIGIETIPENQYSIFLSPNPATSEITIESGAMEIAAVEIYDVVGQRMKRLTLNPSPKGEGLRIDVTSLAEGIYFVTVRDEKGNRVTKKFVKM